jgi:hypothetical protein
VIGAALGLQKADFEGRWFPKPVRLLGVSLSALKGELQAEPQLGLPI